MCVRVCARALARVLVCAHVDDHTREARSSQVRSKQGTGQRGPCSRLANAHLRDAGVCLPSGAPSRAKRTELSSRSRTESSSDGDGAPGRFLRVEVAGALPGVCLPLGAPRRAKRTELSSRSRAESSDGDGALARFPRLEMAGVLPGVRAKRTELPSRSRPESTRPESSSPDDRSRRLLRLLLEMPGVCLPSGAPSRAKRAEELSSLRPAESPALLAGLALNLTRADTEFGVLTRPSNPKLLGCRRVCPSRAAPPRSASNAGETMKRAGAGGPLAPGASFAARTTGSADRGASPHIHSGRCSSSREIVAAFIRR